MEKTHRRQPGPFATFPTINTPIQTLISLQRRNLRWLYRGLPEKIKYKPLFSVSVFGTVVHETSLFSDLNVTPAKFTGAGRRYRLTFTVTNTGKRAGAEVRPTVFGPAESDD